MLHSEVAPAEMNIYKQAVWAWLSFGFWAGTRPVDCYLSHFYTDKSEITSPDMAKAATEVLNEIQLGLA